ncbi:MAG: phosphatidate cytidylyltransferase [Nitrospirota bacterium]|nr:MAG: phosphatidate cytidylyltransferase [Nitrospirota bacterium]
MNRTRILTALVLLPVLILYVMYLPPLFFLLLLMAVALIGQTEFYALYGIKKGYRTLGLIFGASLMLLIFRDGAAPDDYFAVLFITVAVIRLFSDRSPGGSTRDVSIMTIGIIYVPLLLSYMTKLREFGPQWVLYLLGSVWCSDSCAYFIGRSFGKVKLYETMSPNKTMAGAFGSIAGGLIMSLFLNIVLNLGLSTLSSALIGSMIGFVTIIGDLIESMFKRDSGMKDSGDLIPGHGGILDKVDGMVLASPVLYWTVIRIVI